MTSKFKAALETQLLDSFNDAFSALNMSAPALNFCWRDISAAVIYPLAAGGKRVRPTLVGLMAEACGAPPEHGALLRAASALELIHTYSLVHDDLPCMDNDDFRRGQPTTHRVFGEANALLVGDALLTQAFSVLAELPEHGVSPEIALRCVATLSRCSGAQGMIAGQWLDLAFEKSPQKGDWTSLASIHTLKTGALLSAAFSIGTLIGCALSEDQNIRTMSRENLTSIAHLSEKIGLKAGLAFQMIDDVLDVTQSSSNLGKTAGKDTAQNKLTAVSLFGLEGAANRAQELTQECINDLGQLQSKIFILSNEKIEEKNFLAILHFVKELLLRTS